MPTRSRARGTNILASTSGRQRFGPTISSSSRSSDFQHMRLGAGQDRIASMRRLAAVCLALAACFGPNLSDQPFRCGQNHECPPDYTCDLATGFCAKSPGAHSDAPIGSQADGRIDARIGEPDARMGGPDARMPDAPIGGMPDAPIIDARMGGPPDAPVGPPDAICFAHCDGDELVTCTPGGGTVRTHCPVGCTESGGAPAALVLPPPHLPH